MKGKIPFHRPCDRCGVRYQPVTRYNKLCNECFDKSRNFRKPNMEKE